MGVFLKPKFIGILVLPLLVVVGVLLFAPHKVSAATFTVNSTGDASDASVGDGICATGGSVCTLRAAIEEANNAQDPDTINFNISGNGLHTITPATDYPQIFTQLVIDGSTQSASSCGQLVDDVLPATQTIQHILNIAIDGTNVGKIFDDAFDHTTIKGLNLYNAQNALIQVGQVSDVTIECNYLGTNAAGTSDASPQGAVGIASDSLSLTVQNNLISGLNQPISAGGDTTFQNNLVGTNNGGVTAIANNNPSAFSGHATVHHNIFASSDGNGINISGFGFIITGNYIGLNVTGARLGNGGDGIFTDTDSHDYTIGGSTEQDRNVISANGGNGIHIYNLGGNGCGSNTNSGILGNYIGVNTGGAIATNYGNAKSGIAINEEEGPGCILSVYKHRIGGDADGESNTIAGNSLDGIRVYQAPNMDVFGVSILKNKIFKNGNLGINLALDSNDNGDADTDLGPNTQNNFSLTYPAEHANNYLNTPVLNSVTNSGSNVTVKYSFSAPSVVENPDFLLASDLVGFRLDFYINDNSTDGAYSGYSQNQTWLGSFVVDGSETNATHTFTSPITLTSNHTINTTATVVWKHIASDCPPENVRIGTGPPYTTTSCGD